MKGTADYGHRLKALREEQQRLEQKRSQLLDQRRKEIAKLIEGVGVLEADDDALAGALLELKRALTDHAGNGRLEEWRAAGASFRRGHKDRKAAAPRARTNLEQPDPHAPRI